MVVDHEEAKCDSRIDQGLQCIFVDRCGGLERGMVIQASMNFPIAVGMES